MPTTLGDKYHPQWAGYPPHMSREDYPLWINSKVSLLKDALSIYFDVGLGGQTEVPPGVAPSYALMWQRVTQKRIDVLVEATDSWRIIELRNEATSSAIGRLLLYRDMWLRDPPDSRPLKLYLVTNLPDPDVKTTAEALGIIYMVATF